MNGAEKTRRWYQFHGSVSGRRLLTSSVALPPPAETHIAEAAAIAIHIARRYIRLLSAATDAHQQSKPLPQSIRLLEPYPSPGGQKSTITGTDCLWKSSRLPWVSPKEAAATQRNGGIEEYLKVIPSDTLHRYYGALAHAESGDSDKARSLLRQNVDSEGQTG